MFVKRNYIVRPGSNVERRDIDQLPALSLTAVTVMSPDPKQEFRIESLGDVGGDTGTRWIAAFGPTAQRP